MDDDSSLVIHQFVDKYDDSSFKMSKRSKGKNTSKRSNKKLPSGDSPAKRKRKPKPADMPRRPLSAYNIFFQEQRALIIGKPVSNESVSGISRAQLLPDGKGLSQPSFTRKKRAHRRTHGKISFANLAKQIGASWNSLTPEEKKKYEDGAAKEKARYQEELRIYKLNKDKEKEVEEHSESKELLDSGISSRSRKRSSRSASRKLKFDDDDDDDDDDEEEDRRRTSRHYSKPSSSLSSPSGLTIEYVKKKKPHPSRLRGRRYKPMNLAEKSSSIMSSRTSQSFDQICPLPLSFDATRCHPSEIVSEKEMMQAVSPLLKSPPSILHTPSSSPSVFREQPKHSGAPLPQSEDRCSIPSIQTAASNISACSLNSTGTGNDNEMADILTFFLKDGDVDNHVASSATASTPRTFDENVCAI